MSDKAIIDVFGVVGASWFDEGTTVKAVARVLADTEGDILVRINSPGGDVWEGLSIYNLLSSSNRNVEVEVHGMAASSASIIALAGDALKMHTGSLFMIHNPWTVAIGDHVSMAKSAETLAKVRDSILAVYERHFENLNQQDLISMLDAETWLSAEDMRNYGLGVISDFEIAESAQQAQTQESFMKVAACFMNAPDHLAVLAEQFRRPRAAAQPKQREEGMNKKVLAALGLPEDATEEQILAAIDKSKSAPALTDFVPRAEFERVQNNLSTLQQTEAERAEAAKNARIDGLIESALRDGKIAPAVEDFYREGMKAEGGIEAFEAFIKNQPTIGGGSSEDERTGVVVAATAGVPAHAMQLCTQMGIDPKLFEETYHELAEQGLIT